jgi:hypothetical protein
MFLGHDRTFADFSLTKILRLRRQAASIALIAAQLSTNPMDQKALDGYDVILVCQSHAVCTIDSKS